MPKVIVSVVNASSRDTSDFEIPSNARSEEVALRLAEAFGDDRDCDFELESPLLERALGPDETFQDAGIWDGSILLLTSVSRHAPPDDARTPLLGWKTLDGITPREEKAKSMPTKGFVWKRLD